MMMLAKKYAQGEKPFHIFGLKDHISSFSRKNMFMHQKMHFEGKINEIFYFKNPHTTFLVLGPFVMVLKIGLPTQKIEQSAYIALQQKVLVFTKVLFD